MNQLNKKIVKRRIVSYSLLSAAFTYSPYGQGKDAGKIVYEILINGKDPSSFEFKPTLIGDQSINLARAKTLGLERDEIPSTILINSKVIETFPWEK